MTVPVPLPELSERLRRFRARMDTDHPRWSLGAIFGRVNQFYFTGTMQDGVLLVPRDREATLWVRRSFERARAESLFPDIRPMKSFRDALPSAPAACEVVHLDADVVPVGLLDRFRKYFPCRQTAALDAQAARVRAVKSPYELERMERAGAIHRRVLEDLLPGLLHEGMSEADLGCELFSLLVREGHQGLVRFAMFGTEISVGLVAFGENSLCPNSFDGPGGFLGLHPAAPVLGSRDRLLQKGDLVFIDIGCGVEGYQTDKTLNYIFGGKPSADIERAQQRCVEIERRAAAMLKPGAVPSQIYRAILDSLDADFLTNFMGFGARRVGFLGHGVGLHVDEIPVIADGFDDPLAENMVLAIEPKKGIPGFGMAGTENTFVVTPQGGRSLTGDSPGLLLV